MSGSGEERLRQAARRLKQQRTRTTIDAAPCTPFDVAMLEQMNTIRHDLDELTSRVWWLITIVIAAAIANAVIGFLL